MQRVCVPGRRGEPGFGGPAGRQGAGQAGRCHSRQHARAHGLAHSRAHTGARTLVLRDNRDARAPFSRKKPLLLRTHVFTQGPLGPRGRRRPGPPGPRQRPGRACSQPSGSSGRGKPGPGEGSPGGRRGAPWGRLWETGGEAMAVRGHDRTWDHGPATSRRTRARDRRPRRGRATAPVCGGGNARLGEAGPWRPGGFCGRSGGVPVRPRSWAGLRLHRAGRGSKRPP